MRGIQTIIGPTRAIGFKLIALGTLTLAASVLILFGNYEISGEGWSYWLWAKVLGEDGTFNVSGRSGINALYLNAFVWMGYPASVTVELLVSGLIVVAAMVTLLRSYIGLGLAFLAALLWLPFMQTAEPGVQKLALALALWALHLRIRGTGSGRLGSSYALFLLAGLFRAPFFIFPLLLAIWDVWQARKAGRFGSLAIDLRSIGAFSWPIALVVAVQIWMALAQSPHPWNNIWTASTTWFPLSNPKSVANSFFIHHLNVRYIEEEYGTFRDIDWYTTNDEVFDGETTPLSAFLANPTFVVRMLAENVKPAIFNSAKFMELSYLPLLKVYDSLVLAAIFVGAFLATRVPSVRIYVVGSVIIHAMSVAILPGPSRHFVPLIPVLILGAYFYGSRLRAVLTGDSDAPKRWVLRAGLLGAVLVTLYVPARVLFAHQDASRLTSAAISAYIVAAVLIAIGAYRAKATGGEARLLYGRLLVVLALVVPLVFLSTGATAWASLTRDFVDDVRHGELRMLAYDEDVKTRSMRTSFDELAPLISDCKGIMSREHTFLGAFMDVPLDRLYDVWEIPPFGRLGESEYDGLRPDRVDCVLVSDVFATQIGAGTNAQIRYDNYVEPYVQQLKQMGAKTYEIERFGEAIILPK
jgi:hypothetical protein